MKTRERVRKLVKQGKTRIEIARRLGLCRSAVDAHANKIQRRRKKKRPAGFRGYRPRPPTRFVRRWKMYNEALVRRGEAILDIQQLRDEAEELRRMNEGKVGRPFRYPDSLMQLLFTLKIAFKLDYRTLEGAARVLVTLLIPSLKRVPDYTTIYARFTQSAQKLETYYQESLTESDPGISAPPQDRSDEIAIDSTGRNVGERGTYRESKYSTPYRRYVKLHVSVNIGTGQVEALKVTGPDDHDGPELRELVPAARAQRSTPEPIRKAFADRAYDSHHNYELLRRFGIEPVIRPKTHKDPVKLRVAYREILQSLDGRGPDPIYWTTPKGKIKKRKNPLPTRTKLLALKARYETVMQCQKDYDAWRDEHDYGQRVHVENFFSRDTRILGDSLRSRKDATIAKELTLRCSLMNRYISLARSLAGRAKQIPLAQPSAPRPITMARAASPN